MIARMWEARCEPGRTADALAWVQVTVVPAATRSGATGAEVFRSEDRVVVITRWPQESAWTEPEPPAGVVARSHAWPFEVVP